MLDSLVTRAQAGDKQALESLVGTIQKDIYNLALRMLIDAEDAKDASQEIIIRIITKLSTFEFKSSFQTWMYRVASNYLLNTKKVINRETKLSFEQFKEDLEANLQNAGSLSLEPDYPQWLNELRIACTRAMLLGLGRQQRLAYIFGEILELDHNQASAILALSKDNYRQQLSRARAELNQFTQRSCGLINTQTACHCDRRLNAAMASGRVQPKQLTYASQAQHKHAEIRDKLAETRADLKTLVLQRSVAQIENPEDFKQFIEALLEGI